MSENFLSYIYGIILCPVKTFDTIKNAEKAPVFEAFWAVVLVSLMGCFSSFDMNSVVVLGFSLVSYILFAIISWVLMASIIDGLAGVFDRDKRFDLILSMTGFSLLPWILFAPISLIKTAGILGSIISIALCVIIWAWTTILFLLAISKSYELTAGKTILLGLMPFFGGIVVLFWFAGFISNIISIVAV